jgi:hypothetical protein
VWKREEGMEKEGKGGEHEKDVQLGMLGSGNGHGDGLW